MAADMTGEVTQAIAAFAATARFDDIPDTVITRGRIHMLDTLGLALAGAPSDAARLLREHLTSDGLAGTGDDVRRATIFGTRLRAAPRFAAAANAAAIHADNFDDTTPQTRADRTGGIHASGAVLPVVLALAEVSGAPGADVFAAYLIGVEVASRLNHAIGPRHYGDGFHTTGTLNVFGAAMAAGRLMQLDEAALVRAVGLAASRASGVRRNFGTMAEVLHSAHAAEDGIVCADLAARGATAAADALDGPVGYFGAAADGFDGAEIVGRLGNPWVFEDPGVWIKPHPNGALTHPGAACLTSLMRENDVRPANIREIRVRTNERVLNTLIHHEPASAMQAKFSMEFILAVIAVDGRAGLGEFTDANLARADMRDMMGRIAYSAYASAEPGFTNVTTLLDVELKDGRVLTGRADHASGSTAAPMDFDDVAGKFRECAAFGGVDSDRAEAIVDAVRGADRAGTIRELVRLLKR